MAGIAIGRPGQLLFDGADVIASCPTFELGTGEPCFRSSFLAVKLLVVEEGFVAVRSTPEALARSIITCDAGPGRALLPPTADEVLLALSPSRLIGITDEARGRLFETPVDALVLVELLELALSQKQEALGNFAHTRHVERVRRKLVQLAQSYGRVVRDGIRIDFPGSHAVLADMIGSSPGDGHACTRRAAAKRLRRPAGSHLPPAGRAGPPARARPWLTRRM